MPAHAPSQESSQRGLYIKLGVIALALSGATYFALRGDPALEQIDTPESAVPYICTSCGNNLSLTPAGFQELMRETTAQGGERGGERSRGLVLRCPKCQQVAVVKAVKCAKDGTVFALRGGRSEAPKCPKCGWSPAS